MPMAGRAALALTAFAATRPSVRRPCVDGHDHFRRFRPPAGLGAGELVELIGPHQPVDALAAQAGTIGYEILTSLGGRYARIYAAPGIKRLTA